MHIAIDKSKWLPSFLMSAGERFTVTLLSGNLNPEFDMAALTLSLDSLTAVSGNPTIPNAGKPKETSASTVILRADMPVNAHP